MSKSFASLSSLEIGELIKASMNKGDIGRVYRLIKFPQVPAELLSYYAKARTEVPDHSHPRDTKNTSDLELFKYLRKYTENNGVYTGIRVNQMPRGVLREIVLEARKHLALPAEALNYLVETYDYSTYRNNMFLYSVTRNPNLTVENINFIYDKASRIDKNTNVLWNLIRHDNCPIRLLEIGYENKNQYNRMAVARSPRLTGELIRKLLNDTDNVKIALARNASVPLAYFEPMLLAFKNDPKTNKVPQEMLQALVKRCPEGAKRQELIGLLALRSKDRKSRMTVAEFTEDPDVAVLGCYDESRDVRRYALKNPKMPPEGRIVQVMIGPASRR